MRCIVELHLMRNSLRDEPFKYANREIFLRRDTVLSLHHKLYIYIYFTKINLIIYSEQFRCSLLPMSIMHPFV